jgi:hypothetical protein
LFLKFSRENGTEDRMMRDYGAERSHKNSFRATSGRNRLNDSLSEDEDENYKQRQTKRQNDFVSRMPRDSDEDRDYQSHRRFYENPRPNSTTKKEHSFKTRKILDSDQDSDEEVARERRPY